MATEKKEQPKKAVNQKLLNAIHDAKSLDELLQVVKGATPEERNPLSGEIAKKMDTLLVK